MPEQYYIGLMSGTSMDGIDAALVAFNSATQLRVVETHFSEFENSLRTDINCTAQNNLGLLRNEDSPLHEKLAPVYAKACLTLLDKAGIAAHQIKAIANHGQTVKHEPNAKPPYSLQLGNGQVIADQTQIRTITQFRQADLAAGGQGAPLMPAFHAAVLGNTGNTLILNIGGIANLSYLTEPLIGFDTGPGNVLLDQWISLKQGMAYDQDGTWAASGKTNPALLSALLGDPFLAKSFPKSTGTDYFNLSWLNSRFPDLSSLEDRDVQATLASLTVETVVQQIVELCGSDLASQVKLYVCGGGARNSLLMDELENCLKKQRFSKISVHKTDALGVPADWLEAIGFAWLGYCYDQGIASNCPSVTGAHSPVILGQSFSPRKPLR